ncbi:hypothetical protein BH10PSE4_BH10PSE4_39260 [soil metagenome]
MADGGGRQGLGRREFITGAAGLAGFALGTGGAGAARAGSPMGEVLLAPLPIAEKAHQRS